LIYVRTLPHISCRRVGRCCYRFYWQCDCCGSYCTKQAQIFLHWSLSRNVSPVFGQRRPLII